MPPQPIAVLGGGITGLTAAFHLGRRFPNTPVVLLEKEPRLGGWIQSERVQVDGHEVVLESGPRTLRPNGLALLELIHLLKLEGRVIKTSSAAPAAKQRYLHLRGRKGLTQIPNSAFSALPSPLFGTLVGGVLKDLFSPCNRPKLTSDESVHSFLARRFGDKFATRLGSALVHGIYAADSRQLSIRAAFPTMWDAHISGGGSVLREMLRRKRRSPGEERAGLYELGGTLDFLDNTSVFSFREGLQELPEALRDAIHAMPNVELRSSCSVSALQKASGSGMLNIMTKNGSFDAMHVISTIPLPVLSTINKVDELPHLRNHSSSVTVVNLVFDRTPDEIHPPGFGYLIPRKNNLDDAYSTFAVEEKLLGAVFDSAALSAQDCGTITKLTLMLGGPYGAPTSVDIDKLITSLSSHLSRRIPEPVLFRVHQRMDCIPTPHVGHLERMAELKQALAAEPWSDSLTVIGASVGGVSVGDCIESGRQAALYGGFAEI